MHACMPKKGMKKSMSSEAAKPPIPVVVKRPNVETRLGIRLASTTPDDPPVVKAIAGVASQSNLKEGDIILKIDGQEARNSVVATVLFGKAGTTVNLLVRRPEGIDLGPTKEITIARNALGLGLVVDTSNTITDLVAGSAAAEHPDLRVGQRVVAVSDQKLGPGMALAPYIPPGNKPFVLSVVTPSTPVPRAPALPGGSSMASLTAAAAASSQAPGPMAGRVPLAPMAPLAQAQTAELTTAFQILSDGDELIGPSQVLAAVAHFEKDATLAQVTASCRKHSSRPDAFVKLPGFLELMQELATMRTAATAIFDALDQPGIGFVAVKQVEQALRQMASGNGALPAPPPGDVAAMLALLKPGHDGLVHREASVKALHEAFAAPARPAGA